MNGYTSDQVYNGTYGEVWVNGNYLAETKSFRAEVNCNYEAVPQARDLMDGQKLTGLEGQGELVMHKVSSYVMNLLSKSLKAGKVPDITIIGKIDDPSAIGQERIALYHCKFAKMILADWERKKIGEESYSFTFEKWDILDSTK